MSVLQERNFNSDIAAAIGDLVRGRANGNGGNFGNSNDAADQSLAAQIAPVVLASLRTLTPQGSAQQRGVAQQFGSPQDSQTQGYSQQGEQQQPGYSPQQGQPQQGYASQQGRQQQGIQAQQGYQPQPGYAQQQGFQPQQGHAAQHNGGGQGSRLSSRGTLAAAVTPIVAQALAEYALTQNAVRRNNGVQQFDKQWFENVTSIVADVTPAVVDALKTFAPQPGAQQSHNTSNLQAAAQRGAFDDLNGVVAATVPVVINALRDYQPAAAQGGQRAWSDDVFEVARIAAPIAIAAL